MQSPAQQPQMTLSQSEVDERNRNKMSRFLQVRCN